MYMDVYYLCTFLYCLTYIYPRWQWPASHVYMPHTYLTPHLTSSPSLIYTTHYYPCLQVRGDYSDVIVSMSRVYSKIRGDEEVEEKENEKQVWVYMCTCMPCLYMLYMLSVSVVYIGCIWRACISSVYADHLLYAHFLCVTLLLYACIEYSYSYNHVFKRFPSVYTFTHTYTPLPYTHTCTLIYK